MTVAPHSGNFSVTVRDESFPHSEIVETILRLSSHSLTARDLISERVRAECDRRLHDGDGRAAPVLVQQGDSEDMLNAKTHRGPDPERQIPIALKAFDTNGFILLVDNVQVESLDETVSIKPDTVVTFLKLTPLVGG